MPHTSQQLPTAARMRGENAVVLAARIALTVLLLFGLFISPRPLRAANHIIYVNDDAPAGGDGLSWGSAYRYLADAISVASAGDEIWVAAGVYYPDIYSIVVGDSDLPTLSFGLTSGVAFYGGFAGNETQRSQRNFNANVTVLSGDITQNDTTTANGIITDPSNINPSEQNSYTVVKALGVDESAILDGFTITAGKTTDSEILGNCGAGLYVNQGSPTLANITFIGNLAAYNGGGMCNDGSSPTLTNVTFSNNLANDGGGMFNDTSTVTLTNVTFSSNVANYDGGGMFNDTSTVTSTNVTFSSNVGNSGGGGMFNHTSTVTLTNVTFIGNVATGFGGGMYNSSNAAFLTNVIFSGNRGFRGGGVYSEYHELVLTNATFSGNTADNIGTGGGMYNGFSTFVSIQNSILWDNMPSSVVTEGGTSTFHHSLVEGLDPEGTANLDGTNPANNPRFVRDVPSTPGDDDDYGDLRLQAGSPAIDAGDNAADLDAEGAGTTTIANIATDLAGQPRITAVKSLSAIIDMGAYEAAPFPPNAHAGGPYTSNEGSTVALNGAASTDDGAIVSYAWDCTNDGTVEVTASTPTGSTCNYPDNGSFNLRLTATDILGLTGTVTTQVTVANVAPVYTPAPNQSTFAGNATLFDLGSFTDPGIEGAWPVTINWGDGETSPPFNATSAGVLPSRSHTYAAAGTYNVVITVSDGEASDQDGLQIVVNAPVPGAPAITLPADQTAVAGVDESFDLGSFSDANSSGPWQVTVNWGDGSNETLFSATAAGTLDAKAHTYNAAGLYDVIVKVNDGALSTSASFRINVTTSAGDTGSVTGAVLANGNGAQEQGVVGVAGAGITLETASQGNVAMIAQVRTTTTDANGQYRFDNVPPGNYTLTISPPVGYTTIGTGEVAVSLLAGQSTTAPTFTLQPDATGDGDSTLHLPALKRE